MPTELELLGLGILEKEEQSFGHTAVPEKRFFKKLSESTGKEETLLREVLLGSEVITVRTTFNGSVIRSSARSSMIENQISDQLSRLIKTFTLDENLSSLSKSDMRLGRSVTPSDEQIAAVNAVVQNGVSIITGGPGTGKTTMVLGLVRALKSLKLSITLCAPTGKAAKRLGEATGLQKFNPSTVHRYLQTVSTGTAKHLDVMIVDESSMLDTSLLHSLLATIPDGARLVLIGDKDQLPPVASGQPFKDMIETIQRKISPVVNPISTKTEEGVSGIVSAAYSVIHGQSPETTLNLTDHNFEFIECAKDDILETTLDYYFNKIPEQLGKGFDDVQDEIQILSPQRKGSVGIHNLNLNIQENLTKSASPIFATEGKGIIKYFAKDRVIQTGNDYEIGVMNGEIGNILSRNEEGVTVLIDNKEFIYSDEQIEKLELAYAISIHKSQGSEYAAVIVPISSEHTFMLNRNLIYTAITRGKSKVCLVGERKVFENTLKNAFKGSRYTGLGVEIDTQFLSDKVSLSRLTEVYRQKKVSNRF